MPNLPCFASGYERYPHPARGWKRFAARAFLIACALFLGGCATPFVSRVTAFHDTPVDFANKAFVFDHAVAQDTPEARHYEELVRYELIKQGFIDAVPPASATLKVTVATSMTSRDVRVIETVPVDPWYGSPYYGPAWPRFGYYGPFYDPFWYGPPLVQQRDVQYTLYTRQLKIGIVRVADGKRLYDVTVDSQGTNSSLAEVMPYMIRSAFTDFPGPSGVPRIIKLKMQDD